MSAGDDRRRFFVITSGRTGSTLLSAILADAGADFGVAPPDDWDTARGGAMEDPGLQRAVRHFLLAFERSPGKPATIPSKWIWAYHRAAGKRELARVLARSVYLKCMHLDLAIPFVIKLGYFPQIIVNHRPFGDQALSHAQMIMNWSAEALAKTYDRTYHNALLSLHSYGGCVVSYEDLTVHNRTAWATSLAKVTGLAEERLLAGRALRAKPTRAPETKFPTLSDTSQRYFDAIESMSGQAVPPSPQALRNWQRKLATPPAVRAPARAGENVRQPASAAPAGSARISAPSRHWLARLRIEAEALWAAAIDRRVRWYVRVFAPICFVAYVIAPIDPIPDQLPVIGHLDDVIVTVSLVALFAWLVPSSILRQHRTDASVRRGLELGLSG